MNIITQFKAEPEHNGYCDVSAMTLPELRKFVAGNNAEVYDLWLKRIARSDKVVLFWADKKE